jgi:hypothetical protein
MTPETDSARVAAPAPHASASPAVVLADREPASDARPAAGLASCSGVRTGRTPHAGGPAGAAKNGGRCYANAVKRLRAAAQTSLDSAKNGDIEGFRAADRAFHDVIAEAAGNPRVTKAIADAVSLIQALRVRDLPKEQTIIECASAHMRIADAIDRGDDEAAREEMRAHVHYVHHYMDAKTLGAEDSQDAAGSRVAAGSTLSYPDPAVAGG